MTFLYFSAVRLAARSVPCCLIATRRARLARDAQGSDDVLCARL